MGKNFFANLLIGETDSWLTQLFRYLIVGGLSFLVDYGILFALTECMGVYYLLSATISFMMGLVVNYLISTRWIFHKSKLQNRSLEFLVYAVIGVIGLVLNNMFLYGLTDLLKLHYMISKLVAAIIVLGWNFVGRKIILFKK